MLELSAPEALGRAAFAAASVAAASAGHASVAHTHHAFSQQVIAFITLLFATWLTRRWHGLLAASLLAQFFVHGGLPLQHPHMMAMHLAAAVLTLGLLHHSEDIWRALAAVVMPRMPLRVRVPEVVTNFRIANCSSALVAALVPTSANRRGPPAFA